MLRDRQRTRLGAHAGGWQKEQSRRAQQPDEQGPGKEFHRRHLGQGAGQASRTHCARSNVEAPTTYGSDRKITIFTETSEGVPLRDSAAVACASDAVRVVEWLGLTARCSKPAHAVS